MTNFDKISACYPHLTLKGVMRVTGLSYTQIYCWCVVNQKVFDVVEVHKTPRSYWELLEKYLPDDDNFIHLVH